MNKTTYAISYDISNTKRRTKIAKKLKDQGWIRIQYSVWIKKTILSQCKTIIESLDKIPNLAKSDSILLLNIPQRNIAQCKDNNRLKYYLSEQIEHIYL